MITQKQRNWILAVVCILALDAAITIYGATYYNPSFYEANPLLAAAGNLADFTNAVILTKIFAALAVILVTAYCNKNIGEEWGDAVCTGSVAVMGVLFGAIILMNLVVNLLPP